MNMRWLVFLIIYCLGWVSQANTARLLSCNDEAAALKLSEFCEKPFYASHGRVDVNKSGDVFAENDFYLFSNGQKGSTKGSGYSLGTAKGTEGVDFVRLGDAVNGVGNFDEFLRPRQYHSRP